MKNRSQWFLPALLLMECIFLGTTFGTFSVSFLLFVVLSGVALKRANEIQESTADQVQPSKLFSRNLAWGLLLLMASVIVSLWRFQTHYSDTFNPVAFFVDAFAHVCFVLSLLFYVKRPLFGHPVLLGLGLLVVMLSAASGAASQSLTSQVTVAILACMAFLFASRYILHAWYQDQRSLRLQRSGSRFLPRQSSAINSSATSQKTQATNDQLKIGWLVSAVVLSIFLMATSLVANVTSSVLPELQRVVHDQLKSSFDTVTQDISAANSHYVRGSRLGSLRRHMIVDPTEIAFRAHSDTNPGYLRGSAFDAYSDGRWDEVSDLSRGRVSDTESFDRKVIDPTGKATTKGYRSNLSNLKRFDFFEKDDARIATVQIENDPLKGHVFFSPLSTRWVEARARRIYLSNHGVIEHGINARFPYIVGVGSQPVTESLAPARRAVLTHVDESIADTVRAVAQEVCGDQLTNTACAIAIRNYFNAEYEYSLQGVPVPGRDDPLAYFLRTKHPANCELFASATVLLLRSVDVPARYVTGYIADERSAEEECWVARNRDAHAWVEAYDDVTETWFAVESTPGRTYLTLTPDGNQSASLADSLNQLESDASDGTSIVGRFIGWLLSNRATDPLTLLIQVGQWPVLMLGIFLLWRRLRHGGDDRFSPDDVKSHRMLASVDRKLRKFSLARSPSETLHQFASRLERQAIQKDDSSDHAGDLLPAYADWYRKFAEARYQGQLPEAFSPN
ncbi:transglutaminase-like domain-containing protein [Planctomycetes bacterium K23_9]|uniref:Transglutaminase-like superfamily protein n=1 Tax=Stieleria marina TaxID=1930275 RepID=A0A517NSL8_9BACT|nr:Transglutaminase-like superfamily protein [Planctomycetes bacterium K23_9]